MYARLCSNISSHSAQAEVVIFKCERTCKVVDLNDHVIQNTGPASVTEFMVPAYTLREDEASVYGCTVDGYNFRCL